MAYAFQASTSAFRYSSPVYPATAPSVPVAMAMQFRIPDPYDAVEKTFGGVYEGAAFNGYRIDIDTARKIRAYTRASALSSSAITAETVDDADWHWCLGRWPATNSRFARLDFGAEVNETTTRTPGTLTKTLIGARDAGGTLSQNIGFEIAQIAFWTTANIGDEEWYRVVRGDQSLNEIQRDFLTSYADLRDEIRDVVLGSNAWAYVGSPAPCDNPVQSFRYPQFGVTAAATFKAGWAIAANSVVSNGARAA